MRVWWVWVSGRAPNMRACSSAPKLSWLWLLHHPIKFATDEGVVACLSHPPYPKPTTPLYYREQSPQRLLRRQWFFLLVHLVLWLMVDPGHRQKPLRARSASGDSSPSHLRLCPMFRVHVQFAPGKEVPGSLLQPTMMGHDESDLRGGG